jgi:hypothetical protein
VSAGRSLLEQRAAFLLDLDPDLGWGIAAQEWEQARTCVKTNIVRFGAGEWPVPVTSADRANITGLIVIDGVLSRETALAEHVALELLCPGDALLLPAPSPADDLDDLDTSGVVTFTALSETRLAVLSTSFLHGVARWPVLLRNLHTRLEAQRQRLAIQGLTAHLSRAEDRVLLTLWVLATSCGRVIPEGTLVPLALTHSVLAKMSAARRPTITLALRALEESGCVLRRADGTFILTESALRKIRELTRAVPSVALGPSIGLSTRLSPVRREVPALAGRTA